MFVLSVLGLSFLCFLALVLLLIWRNDVIFSITAQWPQGLVMAIQFTPLFGLIPVRFSLALAKVENEWALYHRFRKGGIKKLSIEDMMNARKNQKAPNAIWKSLGKAALKNIDFWEMDVHAYLGLEDAAQCALACGALETVLASVFAVFFRTVSVKAHPQFNETVMRLDLTGILRLRAMQIMKSAFIIVREEQHNRKQLEKKDKEREENVIPTSH